MFVIQIGNLLDFLRDQGSKSEPKLASRVESSRKLFGNPLVESSRVESTKSTKFSRFRTVILTGATPAMSLFLTLPEFIEQERIFRLI